MKLPTKKQIIEFLFGPEIERKPKKRYIFVGRYYTDCIKACEEMDGNIRYHRMIPVQGNYTPNSLRGLSDETVVMCPDVARVIQEMGTYELIETYEALNNICRNIEWYSEDQKKMFNAAALDSRASIEEENLRKHRIQMRIFRRYK